MNVTPPRRARRTATALAGLSAVVALSGCGAQQPGAAAVVNGQTITEASLDDVAADFGRVEQVQVPQRNEIAGALLLGPIVEQSLGGFTGASSAATVRQRLSTQLPNASDATVRVFQIQQRLQGLDATSGATLQKALNAADVQVNPRYGTFDPKRGLTASAPNWLEPLTAGDGSSATGQGSNSNGATPGGS